MTGDQRVGQAREFLAGARKRKVAELPPSLLVRECAELRRLLGQLLTLVDDFEAEERQHDVTGLTEAGGARISPAGVLVLDEALSDAVAYRLPDTCRDCAQGQQCGDHDEDVRRRHAYQDLAAALGIVVEP